MRIAVVNLTSGGLSGGYRKYLRRLMPLLANDRRVNALSVFVPEEATAAVGQGIDVHTWARRDPVLRLSRNVLATKPDVVFIPTARHANFGKTPVVTMVRNMEPLTVPFDGNSWAEGMKNIARAWEAKRACRRATRVIAVSNHVREFIISRWQIDPDRVGTVFHGVDDSGTALGPRQERGTTLFTAGSIRPARGLEDVIRVMAMLDPDVRLTIAGGTDAGCAGYARGLRRLCDELGITSRVTFAGQLQEEEMIAAFRTCSAFLMTSRAEACPNTALEAMSCGCAVVSVDRAPMPEFFGEAALYYPVGGIQALAMQLRALLSSTADQDRLRLAARQRAAGFTWESTRDCTIRELELALP